MPKPPPTSITDVTNISPLLQLLEQIAKQQYKIKALADNQVNIQPKTSEFYITNIKSLAKKRPQFHTHKLKEERRYKVVLKIYTTPSTLKKSKLKLRNYGTQLQISGILNNIELSYPSPCFL
jgi:hypothetical protein